MGDGVGHDVDLSPQQRGGQKLPHGNIKPLRGRLGDDIGFAQLQIRHLAQLVVEHALLLDHHPFGLAGGARGVNHIRQIVGLAVDLRVVLSQRRRLNLLPHQHAWADCAAGLIEQSKRLCMAGLGTHQHRRAAQFNDAMQACAWQRWVQRQVPGPSFKTANDHAE